MFKNIYSEWGYTSNPFQPMALLSNEVGAELLVGRKMEQQKIYNRLISNSGIVTIEGENGIGKTSLVNVVSYIMYKNSITTKNEELFLPCKEHFQLTKEINLKEFIDRIYYAIAQTLIEEGKSVKKIAKGIPDAKYLDVWLNSSEIQSIQAQIASFGAGESREINTGEGFLDSGFKQQIRLWLQKIFPKEENGGIICMIDNLELLDSTIIAKQTLEYLRDELITIPGTKWVFCGSNGIISTIASSTRLSGYLHKSIKVGPLKSVYVTSLLTQRMETFNNNDYTPYMPIELQDFVSLYHDLNGNLRETLRKLDEYCLWVYEHNYKPAFASEKSTLFDKWISSEKRDEFEEIKSKLSNEAVKLLRSLINSNGTLNYSEITQEQSIRYEELKPAIEQLDRFGLISLNIFEREQIRESFETYISPSSHVDLIRMPTSNAIEITDETNDKYEDVTDFYNPEDLEINTLNAQENLMEDIKQISFTPKGRFIGTYLH